MRKFRRRPEAAVQRIEHLERRLLNRADDTRRYTSATPGKRLGFHARILDQGCLLADIPMFFLVGVGNAQQRGPEPRTSIVFLRREVRPAIERLAVGSEKGGEGPSALSAHGLHGGLIAAINVGSLITIHLHRDEMLID